ncbi:MAG: LysM peptidoglycan-binding domain-containing protein [Anaerolineae bacterium]|jgi:LysM repeat protein|nr:LysM peptidoglycan-binding domain-containing protein [Anaerolineae bacterium]
MKHNQYRLILALIVLLFANSLLWSQETTEEPPLETVEVEPSSTVAITPTLTPSLQSGGIYVVQARDTLSRIAARFNTTAALIARENGIVNPNLIYVGQRLRIPGFSPTATPTTPTSSPTPLPSPTAINTTATPVPTVDAPNGIYIVRSGDTLFRIAIRNNTTIAALRELNPSITNANVIYVGQRIRLSDDAPIIATAVPRATSAPSTPTASNALESGLIVFIDPQDPETAVTHTQALSITWVKLEVYWRDLEPVQGEFDFSALDVTVDAFHAVDTRILLTVSAAPDWARTVDDVDGPPEDFETFVTFISTLASRYADKVDAYQIWNEPNIRREWNVTNGHDISASDYVQLLGGAYEAIKAVDDDLLVIAAGLSPTGFNDGFNAVDDRQYLQEMYTHGVLRVSDAIAAHPGGWANPPDAVCCNAPSDVLTHYESPSFFFQDTLKDYHEIMQRNGDDRPLWVTKFGWGSAEDTPPPSADYVYMTYTSLAEQAIYTVRAYEVAQSLDFVGPMFLSNLNGCSVQNYAEDCYYSLLTVDGSPRPVYEALLNQE